MQAASRRMMMSVARTTASSTRRSTSNTSNAVAFPRWKAPLVTCHGDYRDEAWLEKHIGGPLYSEQDKLPHLPVPKVEDTLTRFLPTALPLATSTAEQQALHDAVSKFPTQAAPLQARLLQRASEDYSDSSWLQHWWNTWGYLQVRDPVVINVSYFFQFANDPSAPTFLHRATCLLTAAAQYRKKVCSGMLPVERVGKKQTPLCSVAFKYMFHATRIPQLEQDAYEIHDPSIHSHVIVARKGQFFRMNLVDSHQDPLSHETLLQGLQDICHIADSLQQPELGWLTTGNRDDWARAREQLIQDNPEMLQALNDLQSGALLLCLDDVTPVGQNETGKWCLHGSMSGSAYNRWFDKSIQILVAENGKAAFVGEHSMMDGMPLVGLADHMTKLTWKQLRSSSATGTLGATDVKPIFHQVLGGSGRGNVEALVEKAKQEFMTLINSLDLSVESFHGYGSDFIKKAGYSPDAYVQVAMQLATYRLWDGQQGGTYEATQVRPFLHGRTETTRTVSTASAAFCQTMGLKANADLDDAAARQKKLALLQEAVSSHVSYIGLAAQAQGVDRHFLGLSLLVQNGEKLPDLYSDPVFARAKRWRVSTSHLTHPNFDNWGYGPVVEDGVGLAYSIHKRHCVFNVTSWAKNKGWADNLCVLLEEALLEMRTLVELEQQQEHPKSKL